MMTPKSPLRRVLTPVGWGIAIAAIAVFVWWLVSVGVHNAELREQEAAAFENTEFSLVTGSESPLLARTDGSYYRLTTDEDGIKTYDYSTLDEEGNVVAQSVSSSVVVNRMALVSLYAEVEISVKIIEPGSTGTSRIVREVCVAEAIDTQKPHYEGDPRLNWGSTSSGPVREPASPQCVERATLWVPAGAVQP